MFEARWQRGLRSGIAHKVTVSAVGQISKYMTSSRLAVQLLVGGHIIRQYGKCVSGVPQ